MERLSFGQYDHVAERFHEEMSMEALEKQRNEVYEEKPKSYFGKLHMKELQMEAQEMSKREALKAADRSVNKTLYGEDVYAAINRTSNAIGFMGKDQKNSYQNYDYRGIDDVYNVVGPALKKSGLVVLPTLLEHTVTNVQTSGNKSTFQHFATVKYICVSKEDSTRAEVIVKGEAFDHSDKGLNKAMSAAYKLFAFQTFCIPLEGPSGDTESESIEIADDSHKQQFKRDYFNLLVKKYDGKDKIPKGIKDTAKGMSKTDFILAIKNLEAK